MLISVRPLRPYPPYQEVDVTKLRVRFLAFAVLLTACGGAGSGGTAPQPSQTMATATSAVGGTEEPKQYNSGKTANPSASPDGYGY
jgi:ABC-type transport system substrate-binding protein